MTRGWTSASAQGRLGACPGRGENAHRLQGRAEPAPLSGMPAPAQHPTARPSIRLPRLPEISMGGVMPSPLVQPPSPFPVVSVEERLPRQRGRNKAIGRPLPRGGALSESRHRCRQGQPPPLPLPLRAQRRRHRDIHTPWRRRLGMFSLVPGTNRADWVLGMAALISAALRLRAFTRCNKAQSNI